MEVLVTHTFSRPVARPVFLAIVLPVIVLLPIALEVARPTAAAEVTSNPAELERTLKATILYNVTMFVEWPDSAFATARSPLVIGVLGNEPMSALLTEVFANETIKNRPCTVLHSDDLEDLKEAHVLFLSLPKRQEMGDVLKRIGASPVLTVSDIPKFCQSGGMVNLATEDNRVRLEINPEAARSARLTVSSKLLRLARIVGQHG